MPVLAQVDVGKASIFRKAYSAEQLEAAATQQYAQMMAEARNQRALVPEGNAQLQRLRTIAQRIIPHAAQWNDRARHWRWEVNLIGSKQINAFCMPGGKIAFYTGILDQLKLSDDETAMVMGHEMAHALREHGREQMGKSRVKNAAVGFASQYFGLGQLGQFALNGLAEVGLRKFSREDESEADLVGLELAARSGFNPQAGASLWRKMNAVSGGSSSANFFSTHPSGPDRIRELEANAPKVQALYEQARRGG